MSQNKYETPYIRNFLNDMELVIVIIILYISKYQNKQSPSED